MNVEDYTQQLVEEEGTFRMFPISWTLEESEKTGSVALAIRMGVSQKWHGREAGWSEQYPPGWYSEHRAWILIRPKDGQGNTIANADPVLSEKTVKRLAECGLWDGDFDKIQGPPPAVYVLCDIELEQQEGYKARHRINWVNPNADEPKARGAFAPVDRGLLDKLRAKHQQKARAITSAPPGTAPAAPPPPHSPVQAVPVAPAAAAPVQTAPAAPRAVAPAAPRPPAPQAAPAAAPGPQGTVSAQPPAWGAGAPTAAPIAPARPSAPGRPSTAAPSFAPPPSADGAVEGVGPDGVPF